MAHRCFKNGCELEVQYVCFCLGSQTYSCEFHIQIHLKSPNRIHNFDSILIEPTEGVKCAIFEFLAKEKSKKAKLKKIALAAINKNYSSHKDAIKKNSKRLDSDLKEISNLIEKISEFPEKEGKSSLNPFILQQDEDVKRDKEALTTDSGLIRSINLFCELGQLRNKRSEILNRANNDREIEQDFRRTCSLYEKYSANSLFSQAYQEYINAYHKIASTYLIETQNNKYNLFIYDTESEREEVKDFKVPSESIQQIIQLPNSELFLINFMTRIVKNRSTRIPEFYIANRNYRTQKLASKQFKRCFTGIYFNESVYCFVDFIRYDEASSSNDDIYSDIYAIRFDLTEYRWIKLAKMKDSNKFIAKGKKEDDILYDSCIESAKFNSNILISNSESCNLLLYSIDIDSFSEIPYKFSEYKSKILINGEERLYLVESNKGWIYESEIEDEYIWNKIARSIIDFWGQVYCSYNKRGFYISTSASLNCTVHYKFYLSQKSLTDIACYGENLSLKRLDGKIEIRKCYGQNIKINFDHSSAYILKRYSLYYIFKNLKDLERYEEGINKNPTRFCNHLKKGDTLCNLGRHLEAIDCYDREIKLNPRMYQNYFSKGNALNFLGRNAEAIKCYNTALRLNPGWYNALIRKADALYSMCEFLEEIKCYNEIIKKIPNSKNNYLRYRDTYIKKADALYDLNWHLEAINCYNGLIKFKPDDEYTYIRKADALHSMGKNLEAVKCFNEATKLNSNNHIYFCYRANMLNDLGEVAEAILDFKKAYELIFDLDLAECDEKNQFLVEDSFELLKMLCNLLESTVEFKEKIQKIKDTRINAEEILNEIEKKEAVITEKNSQLVKGAVIWIDWRRRKLPKPIEQTKEEITEHQKIIIDELAKLLLLLGAQG